MERVKCSKFLKIALEEAVSKVDDYIGTDELISGISVTVSITESLAPKIIVKRENYSEGCADILLRDAGVDYGR